MKNIEKYINLNKQIAESKNISEIENIKNEVDKLYNSHIFSLKLNEKFNTINDMSFGDVKCIFEKISTDLFKSKNGRLKINEFINTIKENKSLMNMYILHESICSPNYISDAKLFLNEALSLIGNINKKDLKEGVNKLSNIISTSINYIDVNDTNIDSIFNSETKSLNESIDYIATNKKTIKNLSTYTNKINEVSNFIEEHLPKIKISENKCKDIDELTEKLINDFNSKYSDKISVNESDIIKTYASTNDKKTVFEVYKTECIELIDSVINNSNEEVGQRLTEMKDKISKKIYNEETLDTDITYLIDLKNTLLA